MVFEPRLPKILMQRSSVHQIEEDLRAQRKPCPVEPLVVSCLENGIVESQVNASHTRTRQRAGKVVEPL